MKVLFTSGRAFLPQNSGGVQSSTLQLAEELKARGHEAGVLCKLSGGDWTALHSRISRFFLRTRFSNDTRAGLPVFRAWDPTDTTEVVHSFRPDVAIVQSGDTIEIAKSLDALNVPVVIYYRHVEFEELTGDPTEIPNALHISNSQFTASKYHEKFGVNSTVIPPLVKREKYATVSSRENVTFINPYPIKGRDIAFDIMERCPDIPFTVCESWGIDAELRQWLTARVKNLSNVTIRSRTDDMRLLYGKAKVLLAPSIWEEAWGRVATEAHFSGIPVLGSNRGGLKEAIGPGGLTLDITAPIDEWVSALRRLWGDKNFYAEKRRQAEIYSKRIEIDPSHQIDTLTRVLEQAIAMRGIVQTSEVAFPIKSPHLA